MGGIGVQLCDNCRQYFGKMFSDDTEVVRLVGKVMPLVASFQVRLIPNVFETSPLTVMLLDRRRPREFLWRSSSWTRRAYNRDYRRIYCIILISRIGRQHLGALFNLVAYYVLALPMGITLAFHPRIRLGLQGLWIGK